MWMVSCRTRRRRGDFRAYDAAVGIRAAKSGGVYGIGVARRRDADLLRATRAHMVLERLDTIDVHALLSDGSAEPGLAPGNIGG